MPQGTVTFLFTDVEGSTRRWEADAVSMQAELELHDKVLRDAVAECGGWLFKHTGDGVCAVFDSAAAAVEAAVIAQRGLALPVRMGVATGEAHQRDGDYFGPTLNRTARVMAAGHGGQILVAGSTAALVDHVEFLELGEHRLRDLSEPLALFQVVAEGLPSGFGPLRTLNATPGNLPVQLTSFVGREAAVRAVDEAVRAHRLVTLTGVGGVGKTRLALHAAGELSSAFVDGVWLVELAAVTDEAVVPDVIAASLGIVCGPGHSAIDALVRSVGDRQLLLVLDNCEHVVDAVASVVSTLLRVTARSAILATSREGLQLEAEQLWPVPSLGVDTDGDAAAVALFAERARAVLPGFDIEDLITRETVREICQRLDGIPLAIELAAARMVSLNAQDIRDRLGDRFRLLSGGRRGVDRHQTLRQAVAWSYDLLNADEQHMLDRCAVFADGFDALAASVVCALDEYTALDVLDSLVRKSLINTDRSRGHIRYGMLETIRQFCEENLVRNTLAVEVRDRHAAHYAAEVRRNWGRWNSSQCAQAAEWTEQEMANLRVAFRHAAEGGDLAAATSIAAHTAMINVGAQRYEPAGWAEELLPAAEAARLPELPRLYLGAAQCLWLDRVDDALGYARLARSFERSAGFDGFEPGWAMFYEANALRFAGRLAESLQVFEHGTDEGEFAQFASVFGRSWLLGSPGLARTEEALDLAEEALTAARKLDYPFWIAASLTSVARAAQHHDLERSRGALEEGLAYSTQHRLGLWEAVLAREAAGVFSADGDPIEALSMFERAVDSFDRSDNVNSLIVALIYLAVFFRHHGKNDLAAVLHGATSKHPIASSVTFDRAAEVQLVERNLGRGYPACAARGAAMTTTELVRWTRAQINDTRSSRAWPSSLQPPTAPS